MTPSHIKLKPHVRLLFVMLFAMTASAPAIAAETEMESRAIRCASTSYLLGFAPGYADLMADQARFWSTAYGAAAEVRLGKQITNALVDARRKDDLVSLRTQWHRAPDSVKTETALCDAWRDKVAQTISAGTLDRSNSRAFVASFPAPATTPRPLSLEVLGGLLDTAFAEWDTSKAYEYERARADLMAAYAARSASRVASLGSAIEARLIRGIGLARTAGDAASVDELQRALDSIGALMTRARRGTWE